MRSEPDWPETGAAVWVSAAAPLKRKKAVMPLAKLRAVKKAGRAAVDQAGPGPNARIANGNVREPRHRMLRREMIQDRHVSKQHLRELTDEWPVSRFPQHVCD